MPTELEGGCESHSFSNWRGAFAIRSRPSPVARVPRLSTHCPAQSYTLQPRFWQTHAPPPYRTWPRLESCPCAASTPGQAHVRSPRPHPHQPSPLRASPAKPCAGGARPCGPDACAPRGSPNGVCRGQSSPSQRSTAQRLRTLRGGQHARNRLGCGDCAGMAGNCKIYRLGGEPQAVDSVCRLWRESSGPPSISGQPRCSGHD